MVSILKFCPACGQPAFNQVSNKKISCTKCDFSLYLNADAAVASIIEYDNSVLIVARAKEPGIGKYALPGGFVDPGETAEVARCQAPCLIPRSVS